MKATELKTLTEQERSEKLLQLKTELFHLRFQQAANQLENPMRIHAVKKDIARLKTVQRELEIAAEREKEEDQ